MKKWQKLLLIAAFAFAFLGSIILNTPAWVVGTLVYKYSQHKLDTINEQGTFWNGQAMLIAIDKEGKTSVPLMVMGWKIKLGLSKFININFSASNQTIADASLTKSGLEVSNVNLSLSLDQLTPLVDNLNSLSLSGNVHLTAPKLLVSKKMQGNIDVKLDNVASGMAPVNPIGSYHVALDLSNLGINIDSTPDSTITVEGNGNINGLVLRSRVKEDKKEQLLQFMTMLGIPQADGSYQFKVF
jgi:hypothetical protein